ncbi:MAG: vitamin K epoxide reductase family protein [Candidatus Micrarchaeaceae archaeon]
MRSSKRQFLILIAMSIIGLISSFTVIYELDVVHQLPPFCIENNNITGITLNCAKVLLSPYSTLYIAGTPISVDFLAATWFIINILMVIIITEAKESIAKVFFKILFGWRFFGLIVVPYMLYLEFFVVKSICIYCTIMHGAIIIDFIIMTYLVFSKKSQIRNKLYQIR